MRIVIGGASTANAHYDSTLVKSIARAHIWFQELISGKAGSLLELAKQHGVSDSYVKKIMPLAFLSPKLVADLLGGKQPIHITNQMLIRNIELPICWHNHQNCMSYS